MLRDLIQAFVAASAAGRGTDAMVLDSIHQHLGIAEFDQLRLLIERIRDAQFDQCVPWSTSTAHFEVCANEVRYVSCAGTVVRLSGDGEFSIETQAGDTMPEGYYRVEAARPYLAAYTADL